jgi:hypothetical protein
MRRASEEREGMHSFKQIEARTSRQKRGLQSECRYREEEPSMVKRRLSLTASSIPVPRGAQPVRAARRRRTAAAITRPLPARTAPQRYARRQRSRSALVCAHRTMSRSRGRDRTSARPAQRLIQKVLWRRRTTARPIDRIKKVAARDPVRRYEGFTGGCQQPKRQPRRYGAAPACRSV